MVVVVHLVWLVAWLIGRWGDSVVPYAPFGWTALALALLAWSVLAYGFFFGRFRLDINNINYTHTEIPPAFKGYKIVHISDLHLSTFDDRPAALQRLVDSINAQQPDVICFTGDLVTMGVTEVAPYRDILRRLHAMVSSVCWATTICSSIARGNRRPNVEAKWPNWSILNATNWGGICCATSICTLCAITTR